MRRRVALVIGIWACGPDPAARDGLARTETVAAVGAAASGNTTTGSAARQACPPTGLWARCTVLERLDRAGLAPRLDSAQTATERPLTVSGFLVRVHNAELEVYVYPDAGARSRDIARLDTTRYLGYTEPVSMQQLPTLIQNANLVAILHSRNDHQRERVGDALTAGPPQPSEPSPTP